MKYFINILFFVFFISSFLVNGQTLKNYELKSPDKKIVLKVQVGGKIEWSVMFKGQEIIFHSPVSLLLQNGDTLGKNVKIISARNETVNTSFKAINYKKDIVEDIYNQLVLKCKGEYGLIFRVYNDAIAYRFFTGKKEEIIIKNEEANFNFNNDCKLFVPYLTGYNEGGIFNGSFESQYREIRISQFASDSISILPLLADLGNNVKVEILEADLEDYPGMYLNLNHTGRGLKGMYAPYPLKCKQGGNDNVNYIPVLRADYIAKTKGTRNFPWRAAIITENDIDILNCDIVQKLASPSRIENISWIVPGQAQWDWWCDYNLTNVDFRAGMNTATFKYHIDFAASNKVKYIVIDAGWSDMWNVNKINPEIDMQEIIDYGKSKGVGVFLWAAWHIIYNQMQEAFPKYAKMGIKGWKIDYFDRDDQIAVQTTYEIAELAARNKLMVDYHGIFKPTGLQRTFPNVVGFEGVYGLENYKFKNTDAPRYAVIIPFIRNVSGPMDYTSGSFINATNEDFRVRYHAPMSKGTRCNQIAQYVVFDEPLQMLSESPSLYIKEQECTDFITEIPTTFDKTIPLEGKVAEYIAIAKQKKDVWYIGAMTNWTPRTIILDLIFLENESYKATILKDGINADRNATDYKKEILKVSKNDKIEINLSKAGGWVCKLEKIVSN